MADKVTKQPRRYKFKIIFTDNIKITTGELTVAALVFAVLFVFFFAVSVLSSVFFTRPSETSRVTGICSVPCGVMAFVCIGFLKMLTLKDGRPSCRIPWWPDCLLPRDLRPIIESEDTSCTHCPHTKIDILGRIESSLTAHFVPYRDFLPTDRTSADFEDIPTDTSPRRRQRKLSEMESAEEPCSDDVFVSEDSVTLEPVAGGGRVEQKPAKRSLGVGKGGRKPKPGDQRTACQQSLAKPVLKRDSSAVSALTVEEGNKRPKPDEAWRDVRHPLEPRVIVRGGDSDVLEPRPVCGNQGSTPSGSSADDDPATDEEFPPYCKISYEAVPEQNAGVGRRSQPTAYVVSVHFPATEDESSHSWVNPAVAAAIGDGRADLGLNVFIEQDPRPGPSRSRPVGVAAADVELTSSSVPAEAVLGERADLGLKVGVQPNPQPGPSRNRPVDVAAADVESVSSCVPAEAVVEKTPSCSAGVKAEDGEDSHIDDSVPKPVDQEETRTLSASAPAILAAFGECESEDPKRTVSERSLAGSGIKDAEGDASEKESRASDESQKVESELDSTTSGRSGPSESISSECKESSGDTGAAGASSSTPLSGQELCEPVESQSMVGIKG